MFSVEGGRGRRIYIFRDQIAYVLEEGPGSVYEESGVISAGGQIASGTAGTTAPNSRSIRDPVVRVVAVAVVEEGPSELLLLDRAGRHRQRRDINTVHAPARP
jgi:hypothetical protein